MTKVRSHLQSLGEGIQAFEALKSIENIFIKKRLEESQDEEQKRVTNFFPVTQLVLI